MPQARRTARKSPLKPAASTTQAVPSGLVTEAQIRAMPASEYMSDGQLAFFKALLLVTRREILERQARLRDELSASADSFADVNDRATAEEERGIAMRLRERENLLLGKVEDSLRRIADGSYGYCEKTGDAIGIPRLLARPTATVCIDVKGRDERAETHFHSRTSR